MAGESQSLYRKYRPTTFGEDELVGQEAVARTLRNAIRDGRVHHAYLFCGPRGTGKTSTARLLAKAVNCEHAEPERRPCNECRACRSIGQGENRSLDIIEIDAASNRGIDDIRDLREKINFSPSELTYKFYIIDEVHQLSEAAANALLKTLEEPPRHAKFVLATTDPQKMLETIVSRCQMFRFRRIPLDRMVARLRHVCAAEGLTVDDDALALIARQATGSLRDALGLLDKLVAYGADRITAEIVRQALGIHGDERVVALLDAILDEDLPAALHTVNEVVEDGIEPRLFTQQVVEYGRELLLRLAGGPAAAGLAPLREAAQTRQAARTSLPVVADLVQRLSAIDYALDRGAYGALPLELALVELALARQGGTATAAAPAPAVERPAPIPRPLRPVAALAAQPAAPVESAAPPAGPRAEATPVLAAPSVAPPNQPPTDEEPPATPAASGGDSLALEQVPEIWRRVMRDMNAHHKRLHALLREADPILIDGGALVLAATYEFHHKQINQDVNRQLIEQAIERHAGHPYRLVCILANEADAYRARLASLAAAPTPPTTPPEATLTEPDPAPSDADVPAAGDTASADEPEAAADDEARVRAAINIFNAQPI
jgi:DNA polymerase-3 subunit gamma/tau